MENNSDNPKPNHNSIFSEWLEKLQQESWQLELLISGFALYGIFDSRTALDDYDNYMDLSGWDSITPYLGVLQVVLHVGWVIFFVNLLVHVILRGLWIGAIGLRYISGEIDYAKLNYSAAFTEYLQKKIGSYDQFIERLEKICSVLFAYTFLLFLMFLSLILFGAFFGLGAQIVTAIAGDSAMVDTFIGFGLITYLLLGLIVFIDFITLGVFKKINETVVAKVYKVLYRFFSTITLSFLYRPLLYNFIDHKYTRRLFYFSIPYILLIISAKHLFSHNNYSFFPDVDEARSIGTYIDDYAYEDRMLLAIKSQDVDEQKSYKGERREIVLDKYYMDSEYPSLFIYMRPTDQDYFSKGKKMSPFYKSGFRWDLFTDSEFEDPEKKQLEDDLDKGITSIRKVIRVQRDSSRAVKDSVGKLAIERSIQLLKDSATSMETAKQDQLKNWSNQKIKQVLDTMRTFFTIHINEVDYTDSLRCYFYQHPNLGEKGLLCHFPSANIAKGSNELKVDRTYYWERKNIEPVGHSKVILPFIKVK